MKKTNRLYLKHKDSIFTTLILFLCILVASIGGATFKQIIFGFLFAVPLYVYFLIYPIQPKAVARYNRITNLLNNDKKK